MYSAHKKEKEVMKARDRGIAYTALVFVVMFIIIAVAS
jgi:hypothetical protein